MSKIREIVLPILGVILACLAVVLVITGASMAYDRHDCHAQGHQWTMNWDTLVSTCHYSDDIGAY